MQFEFNGEKYRVQFHHEKSRRWSDHVGHHVKLARLGTGNRVTLYCNDCGVIPIGNIPQRDWQRRTTCLIQVKNGDEWFTMCRAAGTPNESAGDSFNRADGRKASLTNALRQARLSMREKTPDFMDAAWVAYDIRKAPKVRLHVG